VVRRSCGEEQTVTKNEILVGVDGSAPSDAAVIWAADEAASRGARLNIVHACDMSSMNLWAATPSIRAELRAISRPLIDDAIRLVEKHQPTVAVRGRVLIGAPVRILVLLSKQMDLIVIGRSGRGALSRIWFGSVTERVLAHASSPVVAVASKPDVAGPQIVARVVVAVDDGALGRATLRFATEEAQRRHVPLDVVDAARIGPEAETLLADHAPGDLVVLGHHRRPAVAPRQLGRVPAAVMHQATCSVALVPELRPVAVDDQNGALCVLGATGTDRTEK
jgi:nucleotide-binding universal stress UspA family protein